MICHFVDELLDLYLDGRLIAFEARLVESHLAACPGCASKLALLKRVRLGLRELAVPEPPVDFKAGLKAALLAAAEREAPGEAVYEDAETELAPAFSLAFSVTAFLLFASGSLLGPGLPSQSCTDNSTTVCAGPGAEKGE